MNARSWWTIPDVTPIEATLLLCQINPLEADDLKRVRVEGDKIYQYKLLLRVFEGEASTALKPRMLVEWRTIAQKQNLPYFSWVDDFADAMGALAEKQAAPDAIDNTANKANELTPGKIPMIAIGKLAIETAWQIECELGRKASTDEVIKKLQERVGKEDVLIEIIPHGVKWITSGLQEKNYEKSACSKTLETWNKSRA
ncbi:hypothetical protein [Candidatus Nitrotoga sp. AM1P]|uniref:hypothetical protein n=1 Tax=Candidatus Nitrotoga sp. AM1P TaxID=2559597 RepID=UPI0010B891D7|nr:hypothetical protein [Candidatus Nitrotoga sp. AM1P]BBJ24225.1 hypothetical protein W01_21520 [Candidatus Nitrotoga sp. AM1P]